MSTVHVGLTGFGSLVVTVSLSTPMPVTRYARHSARIAELAREAAVGFLVAREQKTYESEAEAAARIESSLGPLHAEIQHGVTVIETVTFTEA